MREYDVYLPLTFNDGRPVPESEISRFKRLLLDRFGGFTHFPQQNEGVWSLGGVVFHDRVVVLRVLSGETEPTRRFLAELRVEMMRALEQADVLIVERNVRVVR